MISALFFLFGDRTVCKIATVVFWSLLNIGVFVPAVYILVLHPCNGECTVGFVFFPEFLLFLDFLTAAFSVSLVSPCGLPSSFYTQGERS